MNFLKWLWSILNSLPSPTPTPVPVPPGPAPANDVEYLAREHNRQRTARSLLLLTLDSRLNKAAQKHAEEMARRGLLSHVGLDGSGAGERMMREGWSGRTWGENIAFGQKDVAAVMTAWMNSTGHRSNILSSNFKIFGIGIAKDKNGRIYWCVAFGG